MATEENDLNELQTKMEGVVGPGPAATLMRHLSPSPWPDVATKADLRESIREAIVDIPTKADMQVGLLKLENTLVQRLNQQTLTMMFTLIGIVIAISSVTILR